MTRNRIEGMAVKHDAYLNVSTTTTVNTVTVNTNRIYALMIVYCRFSDKQYKLALPNARPRFHSSDQLSGAIHRQPLQVIKGTSRNVDKPEHR